MSERTEQLKAFLMLSGWGQAQRRTLAGDASNRKYFRLTNPNGQQAVLMDAPPSKGEDIAPFISVAQFLSRRGFSAPKILARDMLSGFLLLEDLGDDLFARVLEKDPSIEEKLYCAATDALILLHKQKPRDGLPSYGPFEMAEAACLAIDWYAYFAGQQDVSKNRSEFRDLVEISLNSITPERPVVALRDYHAENLIWLPRRHKARRVGLLDFQDAMLSHPAYDLASLLHDARRDVSDSVRDTCIARYIQISGYDAEEFARGVSVCSAQRNLRIMGVFARLSIRDYKPSYPDLMPRVWRNLMLDLKHPDLAELRGFVESNLPAPSPEIIEKIKATHV